MMAKRIIMIILVLNFLSPSIQWLPGRKKSRPKREVTTTIHPQLLTPRIIPAAQQIMDAPKQDHINVQMKQRITRIAAELVEEDLLKIQQISGIRDDHIDLIAFDVGVVIGNIYEKYKTIMEYYRQLNDRFRGRTSLYGPHIVKMEPLMYLTFYEFMHTIEMDIVNLLDVLESISEDELNQPPIDLKKLKNFKFRADSEEEEENKEKERRVRQQEHEQFKEDIRQKYMLRQMGRRTQ